MTFELTTREIEDIHSQVHAAATKRADLRAENARKAWFKYTSEMHRLEELEEDFVTLNYSYEKTVDSKVLKEIKKNYEERKKLEGIIPQSFEEAYQVDSENAEKESKEPETQKRYLDELIKLRVEDKKKLEGVERANQIVQRKQAEALAEEELAHRRLGFAEAWRHRLEKWNKRKEVLKRERNRAAIFEQLSKRRITKLLHFSPLENIGSIAAVGIQSRSWLTTNGIDYSITDNRRLDGWLDHVSLSIEFPNYQMLYKKRMEKRSAKWAIVILDANLLNDCDARFYPTNAGRYRKENYEGDEFTASSAFNRLFDEPRESGLPLHYASNPQAEVMVPGGISPKHVKEIHFFVPPPSELLKELNELRHKVVISKQYFDYRRDWRFWQKRSVEEILMG